MKFICGEYFAENSKYVFDNGYLDFKGKIYIPKGQNDKNIEHNKFILYENKQLNNNYIFANPNYLKEVLIFLSLSKDKFTLITHKLDSTIDENFKNRQGILFRDIINHEQILHWYAQNANINHKKITYIPIGIECPRIELDKIISQMNCLNRNRTNNFLINFNPNSRYVIDNEREKLTNILNQKNIYNKFDFLNREQYIEDLTNSYFCLSPMGTGIDCHRTWTALYCGAIPILTKNYISEKIALFFPTLLIDKWQDLNFDNLNQDLYFKIKENKLEINNLNLNNFIEILNIFNENSNSINSI
jgi:hypothetical protein